MATPLFLVLVLVEVTDLVFAIDSIPAIFGVTRDPFIVFTSNIFAILGLRSLYFLLAAVVDRFHLLKYGIAVILMFVGVKMLGEQWFHIDILVSLAVILGVLGAVDRGESSSGRSATEGRASRDRRGENRIDVRRRAARRAGSKAGAPSLRGCRAESRSTAARAGRRSRVRPSATDHQWLLARSNASRYISSRLPRIRSRERDMRIFSRALRVRRGERRRRLVRGRHRVPRADNAGPRPSFCGVKARDCP